MKKVSILSLHLGYGGIEKSIVTLANILCHQYEVEIACCYQLYDKSAFPLDDRVHVQYLNPDTIRPNHEAIRNSIRRVRIFSMMKEGLYAIKVLRCRKKSMIYYIQNCSSDIIISTRDIFNEWTGKYAKEGIIKIGWEHNHPHGREKYARRIVNSVKGLDYFVLVSSALKEYYSSLVQPCKCVFIPNCIDSLPDEVSSLNEKRLISVGRLSPEKGYRDLLEVFLKLHQIDTDWVLDIIGDGKDKEELESWIHLNHLEEFITLHGYQDKNYIDSYLQKSSIYLMCSHTESFGIVLIEAMSHGVPCIAMDSAEGACEIIQDGENGYLISNRNFDTMVKKIVELIHDQKLRTKMGKAARESVLKYTSDVVGKEWFTLLEEGVKDE